MANSEKEDRRKEIVEQLQQRWKCSTHTKSPQTPVWCYSPPGQGSSSICYPLTFTNMVFWAMEIVRISLYLIIDVL